jgi:predicted GH43/DUF377 family glycosyl hydrolase
MKAYSLDVRGWMTAHGFNVDNTYCFNPSIVHLEGRLFLMTYRIIRYAVRDTPVHPWKMWSNGAAYVTKYLSSATSSYSAFKYRDTLASDHVALIDDKIPDIDASHIEFDGTAAFIVEMDRDDRGNIAHIRLLSHVSSLFGRHFNQDCRVFKGPDDQLHVSYNGFVKSAVCMLTRRVYVHVDRNAVFVGDEQFACKDYILRNYIKNVEKNWAWFAASQRSIILYKLGRQITFIDDDANETFTRYSPLLAAMEDAFGSDVIFSLGTPMVRYANGWIAAGHIKVAHKGFDNRRCNDSWITFKKRIAHDARRMHLHGKYVYFMFLFFLDDTLRLTHMSNAFIPTDIAHTQHLPYALVFPCGIHVFSDDNVAITYGEGDARCKLLHLTRRDVRCALVAERAITPANYVFDFMDPAVDHPKIYVFGYYDRCNLGDECFRIVFAHMRDHHFPRCRLIVRNPHDVTRIDNDTRAIIIGGGDIVNPYFLEKISRLIGEARLSPPPLVLMVSVGTPYTDCIPKGYLDFVHHVFTRNNDDVAFLTDGVTQAPVSYVPDIVHMITPALQQYPSPVYKYTDYFHPTRINVAFCLTRTMYRKEHEADYFNMLCKLVRVIESLTASECNVILVPFGTNPRINKENDEKLHYQLMTFLGDNPHVKRVCSAKIHDPNDARAYARFVDDILKHVDVAVCARFHAHVMCFNHAVPVVSVATTRKSPC